MTENQIHLREIHNVGTETKEWLIGVDLVPNLSQHGIFLAGWSETGPGFEFSRPTTPRAQVLATVRGSGLVWSDGQWRLLPEGMAYVTPEGIDSRYRHAGSDWSIVWVTWSQGESPLSGPATVRDASGHALLTCLRHLLAEASGPRDTDAVAAWCTLVSTEARRIGRPPETDSDQRLAALWTRVDSDPAHPWTLAQLADQAGIGEESLRRLCQRLHGTSPMHRVAEIRMRHAKSLLASGRHRVASVALRVGYENPYAFSTAFRRVTGTPPSRWIPGE